MASDSPHRGLLGRSGETTTLDRLLEAVRAGESRALAIRGDAGVGKTALLEYVAEHAMGCRVARAAGVQAEMELAFAGLHQLCAPMLAIRELKRQAPCQEAPLIELIRASAPPARQHDGGASIADGQPGVVRVAQARAQREHRVVHRAVVQSVPVGSVLATEPVDEPAHALLVEVAQTLLGCEVRQRVGDQQTPVLAASAIVDDVMRTATGVVVNPLQRIAVQVARRGARPLAPWRGS